MSKSYTKKPIAIEAIQYHCNNTKNNTDEVLEFCQGKEDREATISEGELVIKTLEGEMRANDGDYIIKGIKGEYYPCKPDIFEASYNMGESEKDIGAYLFLGCSGEDKVAQIVHTDFERIKNIVDTGNLSRIGIDLQSAPISEVGIDGMQIEDIILVIAEIIKSFNSKFPCRENSIVITKLEEAHLWCLKRKMDRETRGVEGKNEK